MLSVGDIEVEGVSEETWEGRGEVEGEEVVEGHRVEVRETVREPPSPPSPPADLLTRDEREGTVVRDGEGESVGP